MTATKFHKAAVSLALMIVTCGAGLRATAQQPGTDGGRPSQTRVQDRSFSSKALARTMKYRVLLPVGYAESEQRYPVLYLLHGWHGDYQNWEVLTNLDMYARNLPLIIVMPDAGDSWYVDSATAPQDRFELYLQDVVEDVDQNWRTLRSGHHRAIAGLSMGGYGALKFALKNPGMFRVAASLSGAFNAPAELADERSDLRESIVRAFGPADSATRKENNLYAIAGRAVASSAPYLFLSCGSGDVSFLEPNRRLASELNQRKVAYEYHELPGAHTWEYWDSQLPSLLNSVAQVLAR